MIATMDAIRQATRDGIDRVAGHVRDCGDIRIGAELKFPVVGLDGQAATRDQVGALFEHLVESGWSALTEGESLIGATFPGEANDTVASCETGYCKAEFSMAHTADLHAMAQQVESLRCALQLFTEAHDVALIGCGIHPVTAPSRQLKMNRSRAGVWGRIFRSNHCIAADAGDDVDLFTVNTANHVHVGVPADRAAATINALNGYAPAQIALGANARVWRGRIDDRHASVAEAFWDWWQPAAGRVGMPPMPFLDLDAYVDYVAGLPCLYVKRDAGPVALTDPPGLDRYVTQARVPGVDLDGRAVEVTPNEKDIALHNSCYWYNARLSRYFTVENRVFDQQPPDALLAPAAMTLGLAAVADEAGQALAQYSWPALRAARVAAYRDGLRGTEGDIDLTELVAEALALAQCGLERRGLGEQIYLEPLQRRLADRRSPADDAADVFARGGAAELVVQRRWV